MTSLAIATPKRRYRRTTVAQLEQARMFLATGLSNRDTATAVGLNSSTVAAIREEVGMSTKVLEPLPRETQEKIIQMYREGKGVVGSPRIARRLNLPTHRVEQILVVYRQRPKPGEVGCRYFLTEELKTAIRRDQREFEKQSAQKYGLSLSRTRRFLRKGK